jgi:hypothetical protein
MPEQATRRSFLALAAAGTTALAGCASFSDPSPSSSPEPVPIGDTVSLSDDTTVTVHDAWIQQTFIYRNGPYKIIGGNPDKQLVCLYTSTTASGTFTLETPSNKYPQTNRPAGINTDRIIADRLQAPQPDVKQDVELVVFEVPKSLEPESLDVIYTADTKTAAWNTTDAIRARLHFPAIISLVSPDLPSSVPTGEETTFEVTLENTGGSDSTVYTQHGVLETDSAFPLDATQIESGSSQTFTTITPSDAGQERTYVFDWGLGYYEHQFTVEKNSSDSDSDSDDGDTTY